MNKRYVMSDDVPSFIGKIQYAEAQLWGRAGRIALADLRTATLRKTGKLMVDDDMMLALCTLRERFDKGRPKELLMTPRQKPHLLFTDGAFEYNDDGTATATIGGLLLTRDGKCLCFGASVPDEVLRSWQIDKTHVIGLVELYAAIVALVTFRDALANDRTILFTDSGLRGQLAKESGGDCF